MTIVAPPVRHVHNLDLLPATHDLDLYEGQGQCLNGALLRTLQYHYAFKLYMPLYRLVYAKQLAKTKKTRRNFARLVKMDVRGRCVGSGVKMLPRRVIMRQYRGAGRVDNIRDAHNNKVVAFQPHPTIIRRVDNQVYNTSAYLTSRRHPLDNINLNEEDSSDEDDDDDECWHVCSPAMPCSHSCSSSHCIHAQTSRRPQTPASQPARRPQRSTPTSQSNPPSPKQQRLSHHQHSTTHMSIVGEGSSDDSGESLTENSPRVSLGSSSSDLSADGDIDRVKISQISVEGDTLSRTETSENSDVSRTELSVFGDSDKTECSAMDNSRRTDREEIRRKLAMGGDEEYYGGERAYKRPNLQTRLQGGMNLQICFMNDTAAVGDGVTDSNVADTASTGTDSNAAITDVNVAVTDTSPATTADSTQPPSTKSKEEDEDFFSKQQRLQQEATMALAQVRPMAHMQLEIEKQNRKKSPIAEIIQVGIPGFSDGKKKKLSEKSLHDMNLAQLQVVVNDLHTQIETLNEELVNMLVERDDLHMQQDSMLVNSEDLLARAQEFSQKVQPPKRLEKEKSGKKSSRREKKQ